jgi:hypothetical protein
MSKSRTTDNPTDSDEEQYFIWYLEELQEAGYVTEWGRAPTIRLADNAEVWYLQPRKRGPDKPVSRVLMQDANYTPDFEVTWHPSARGIFFECPGLQSFTASGFRPGPFTVLDRDPYRSLLEIKGGFVQHSQSLQYSLLAKWVFAVTGRYVQRVIVSAKHTSIFAHTFCPERFRLTDKTLKPRSLGFMPRTLRQFVNMQQVKLNER